MSNTTQYSIGDNISVTDLNGRVYRVKILSIAQYAIAKQLASIEVLAQAYASPHDEVNEDGLFYICGNVAGDSDFSNLILWDDILDHSRTVYLTQSSVYKLTVLPIPASSGKSVRSINEIMNDIRIAIANNVPDVQISYEDITNVESDELEKMKAAVAVASSYLSEVQELESIRPLIQDLKSIDFTNLTSEVTEAISSIQAELATISLSR